MPVRNKGPDLRGFQRRIAKVEPDYPQRAESKIRAIENRRLRELQKVVRESMPEIRESLRKNRTAPMASGRMDTAIWFGVSATGSASCVTCSTAA